MKKNVTIVFILLTFLFLFNFMTFSSNIAVEVKVPDGTELGSPQFSAVLGGLVGCAGGNGITVSSDNGSNIDYYDENETYTMPSTTAIYTSENDPLFSVIVDGEGNTKHVHLPYPDKTIDYDDVKYEKAKYYYNDDELIITYGNDTYVVGDKDESGFYTTVTENGRKYSIERYQKIAGIDDYIYKGQEYEVDDEGFMVAYRREWVESEYTDYDGEKIGNYEDTKLLFRKEVPFNILWRHRPLSEEEQEILYSGPGAGLRSFSTGLSQDGSAEVVVKRDPKKVFDEDSKVGFAKNKKVVNDPMDPMKAKPVKKKKKEED